jgi:hypothetical protein
MLWECTKSFKETCCLVIYGTTELPVLVTDSSFLCKFLAAIYQTTSYHIQKAYNVTLSTLKTSNLYPFTVTTQTQLTFAAAQL